MKIYAFYLKFALFKRHLQYTIIENLINLKFNIKIGCHSVDTIFTPPFRIFHFLSTNIKIIYTIPNQTFVNDYSSKIQKIYYNSHYSCVTI